MAEKKPMIVIKKITVVAGGAHGGAWKVAFADFMTAMMAFFLVMWLLATQSEQSKKAISDHFSTPSIIEYQFNNYGVELTLEKLFLDLVNEPLKVFAGFVTPADYTPNLMSMGTKKIVMAHMAEQLGGVAKNVEVTADSVYFELQDNLLFEMGTATPSAQFVTIMEKVKGVTAGLEDSDVIITSLVYHQSVPDQDARRARNVAEERLDILEKKVKSGIESESVDLRGDAVAKTDNRGPRDNRAGGGLVRIEIRQKKVLPDGKKPRPIVESAFGEPNTDRSVYDNFVNQLANKKKAKKPAPKEQHAEALPEQQ